MVDPVVAEDGSTFERSAILEWLETNNKSPLNPSQTLDPDRLVSNRAVLLCIEKVVLSSTVDEGLRKDWCARKKKSDLEKAQQLFDEGKVLEAAKLGLPRAQGHMVSNYYHGRNGFEKDFEKGIEFAKLAAEGGDKDGQFWLGRAYSIGEGVENDFVAALKWFELAAEQGCLVVMFNIGMIYKFGCHGVAKDFDAAFTWTKKAADGGHKNAQWGIAKIYYSGIGTTKDLAAARSWYTKSSDQNNGNAQLELGKMMAKGEGGARGLSQGVALIAKAADQGARGATEDLMKLHRFANSL
jgi:TPR repeat protein